MKLLLSRPTREDLQRIFYRLSADDLDRARAEARAVQRALTHVGQAALRCPPVPGSAVHGLRKTLVPPWIILFKVANKDVLVLRVLHQRSDWGSLV